MRRGINQLEASLTLIALITEVTPAQANKRLAVHLATPRAIQLQRAGGALTDPCSLDCRVEAYTSSSQSLWM